MADPKMYMAPPSLRIDKWLWFARFYKTRSLAASMIEAGEVAINGLPVVKTSHPVRIGDKLECPTPTGKWRRRIKVLGLGTRRGPVSEAKNLYHELAPSPDQDA